MVFLLLELIIIFFCFALPLKCDERLKNVPEGVCNMMRSLEMWISGNFLYVNLFIYLFIYFNCIIIIIIYLIHLNYFLICHFYVFALGFVLFSFAHKPERSRRFCVRPFMLARPDTKNNPADHALIIRCKNEFKYCDIPFFNSFRFIPLWLMAANLHYVHADLSKIRLGKYDLKESTANKLKRDSRAPQRCCKLDSVPPGAYKKWHTGFICSAVSNHRRRYFRCLPYGNLKEDHTPLFVYPWRRTCRMPQLQQRKFQKLLNKNRFQKAEKTSPPHQKKSRKNKPKNYKDESPTDKRLVLRKKIELKTTSLHLQPSKIKSPIISNLWYTYSQ